jgi:hypothetical protein
LFVDYSDAINWQVRYYLVGYDEHLITPADPALRRYDVLLPAGDDVFRDGVPLATSVREPIAYAHVGVSAADNKMHTLDAEKWGDGRWGGPDRFGNESRVSGPAKIFRVHRDPPRRPEPPPDSESVYATATDYHGRSYYTYRWRRDPDLSTHVFRALDDTLFKVDWSQRPRAEPLRTDQAAFFPDEEIDRRWNQAKREQVATELNELDTFPSNDEGKTRAMAHYRGLSDDALRVLAGLAGNERAFTQVTIQPLHPDDQALANRPGPDNPADFALDADLRIHIDTLDGRSTNRYFYRAAYVDGAHNRGPLSLSSPPVYLPDVLAPLKPRWVTVLGGDRRVTLRWIANRESQIQRYLVYRTDTHANVRDVRMMGDPVADLPAAQLLAEDGVVDLGHGADITRAERVYGTEGFDPDRDLLSGQNAAQYLERPTIPVGTRVAGLDVPHGTPLVVVYRDSKGGLQCTPWQHAPQRWVDDGLIGERDYHYRIVSIREGNAGGRSLLLRSQPSEVARARVIDTTLPEPPVWESAEWFTPAGDQQAIRLRWIAKSANLEQLLERRADPSSFWQTVFGWLDSLTPSELTDDGFHTYEFVDGDVIPTIDYRYRLKVRKRTGRFSTSPLCRVISVQP